MADPMPPKNTLAGLTPEMLAAISANTGSLFNPAMGYKEWQAIWASAPPPAQFQWSAPQNPSSWSFPYLMEIWPRAADDSELPTVERALKDVATYVLKYFAQAQIQIEKRWQYDGLKFLKEIKQARDADEQVYSLYFDVSLANTFFDCAACADFIATSVKSRVRHSELVAPVIWSRKYEEVTLTLEGGMVLTGKHNGESIGVSFSYAAVNPNREMKMDDRVIMERICV